MKPHILIISPALAKGGMERQLSLFLQNYDRSQLQVTLAVLENNIRYELPDDVTLIDLNRRYARDPYFYIRLWRLLKSSKYDLINSKISGVNELVLLFCGLLNKDNAIAEIRNTGKMLHPYYRRMKYLFKVFKKDWWIVCNSRTAQREAEHFLPKSTKIFFVGNGVDTNQFRKNASRRENKEFVIAYAGRITRQKNIELIIRSLTFISKYINPCSFIIQGQVTDQHYHHFLLQEVSNANVTSQVKFVPPQRQTVLTLYQTADVFILPSLFEGTPNVLLEAMSCECVCLCSNAANTDYFLSSDFTFDETSPELLAKKILWVANFSSEEREVIGKQNREYVENSYSVNRMVNAMTQIIQDKLAYPASGQEHA